MPAASAHATMQTVTPRQLLKLLPEVFAAGLVPFVMGAPGVGKSALFKILARLYALKLLDERLSTREPVDIAGMPDLSGARATYKPFDVYPLKGDPLPEGVNEDGKPYQGWLLFFDELNSVTRATQAASYRPLGDRQVGNFDLHPRCILAAAGNRAEDRAIVNELSSAMKTRLVTFLLVPDAFEWIEDVALPKKLDTRVIGYLTYKPDSILAFDPDADEYTFPCPRTYEALSKVIGDLGGKRKPLPVTRDRLPIYAGIIGPGESLAFLQYCLVEATLPKWSQIASDPEKTPVPEEPATCWAAVTHVATYVDDKTLDAAVTYVLRFTPEFQVLFFREMLRRHPEWKRLPAFAKASNGIMEHVHADEQDSLAA